MKKSSNEKTLIKLIINRYFFKQVIWKLKFWVQAALSARHLKK